MSTGYHRQQQIQRGGFDPWWMLLCIILAVALALIALPWIITGFIIQRSLARKLPWRLSFLLWLVVLFAAAFAIYSRYQHGLETMIANELADYILAGKHHQYDLASWPLRQLWAETWPVWLSTWPGVGIVGLVAEVWTDRSDTARTLRLNECRRQSRAEYAQRRARRRTSHPTHIPNEIAGMMVIGVPINDDNEEE